MKIEQLIRTRRSIRVYKQIPVPKKHVIKILEAARWSPSAHNSQTWRFIVIRKKASIKKLSEILVKDSAKLLAGFNIVLRETSTILENAAFVVVVYNSHELSNRMKKFGEPYFSVTKLSEVQGIGAAIQNMLLMAHSLGIGSAWLTMPLFCEKKIAKSFDVKGSLMAIITFGYPNACNLISSRRPVEVIARFI